MDNNQNIDYSQKKEKKEKKETRIQLGEIFERIGQAKIFINRQPIYYSPECLLWIWNFDKYCYELKDDIDLLNKIRKEMLLDTVNNKIRTEILSALKQVGREQDLPKKPKGWIQFQDTLVNPRTLERVKADHTYFLTNPIPHKLGESEETPEIDRLLHEWVVKEGVQDESYVQCLYEYLAYSLTDDLFMQRIIALTGGGSNGKGKFLQLIERLNGRENCVDVSLRTLVQNIFATSSLYKKLVAFAGEVCYDDLTNTGLLKKIAGEDLMSYVFKGKNSFTDDCITTFFIATNSLPATPDKTLGFYRKWAITDFPNVFEIKANLLSVVSEKEYENLCLKSVNILKKLYETHQFTNEGSYEEREKKFEERSNPISTFIENCCEEVVGEKMKLREFETKLNVWLRKKSLRLMTIRQVGAALRALGYEIGKRRFAENPETSSVVISSLTWKECTNPIELNDIQEY